MKIKSGFIVREVADTFVVVPTGEVSKSFTGMITLNESCAFLWELLTVEQSVDSLTKALCEKYDVEEPVAREDVCEFIEQLKTNYFLE